MAKAGYFALSNEQYFRQGELWKMEDIKQVMAGANQLSDEQAFKDLDAAVAWAGKNPCANADKMGITGFCRGGRTVWMYTAHQKNIDAGVAWVRGLSPAPPVIHSAGEVDKLREALKKSNNKNAKSSEIRVYPGVPHAFNADYRPSYRKEAADDGCKRMLAWFKKNAVA
jgi:carboxymethylenebutenolidase